MLSGKSVASSVDNVVWNLNLFDIYLRLDLDPSRENVLTSLFSSSPTPVNVAGSALPLEGCE